MGPLEVLLLLLLWFVPSSLVGRYASGKGHSFWLFFTLGVFASWVVSLIVALVVPDKTAEQPVTDSSDLERLDKLADLHSRGVLTDEEFATKKAEVLGG